MAHGVYNGETFRGDARPTRSKGFLSGGTLVRGTVIIAALSAAAFGAERSGLISKFLGSTGGAEATSTGATEGARTLPTRDIARADESIYMIEGIDDEVAAADALIAQGVVHEATPVTTGRSTGEWVLNGETRTECIHRANQVYLDYTRRGIRFDPSVYWCNWDFSDIEAAGGRRS